MTRTIITYGPIILIALVIIGLALFTTMDRRSFYRTVPQGEVKLITRLPEKNATSMEALILGQLWLVDGCVKIGKTAEESRTTIWRSGFLVGEDDLGKFIHHPLKKTRFRIGTAVRFGGGYVESLDMTWASNHIEGESLRGCPGPFVFVDTTGDE